VKVMVFGGTGQLGQSLVSVFSDDHETCALSSTECDITDYEAVMSAVYALGPDLLVNAAAMTDVDACEDAVERAFAVNAIGPRNLVLAARRLGIDLVHVSTDYVFDGESAGPYDEWDAPRPLSVYGRSKLGGEQEVLRYERAYLVRTAVLYGTCGDNFARTVLRRAVATEENFQVVQDQVGSPTFVPHLAFALRQLSVSGKYGLYHLAGTGSCSRADFARAVIAASGHDPARVMAVTTNQLSLQPRALRPKQAALTCRAWRLAGFSPLPPWQQGVQEFVDEVSPLLLRV